MPNAPRTPPRSIPRNRLLQLMPPGVLDRLLTQLEWIPLPVQTILLVAGQMPAYVYFVDGGSVSMIASLENGEQVEVGLVGSEGFVGLPVLLGGLSSPMEALVQAEGEAWRMPAKAFRLAMSEIPGMVPPLLRYVDTFLLQVSQAAVCNACHQIEQRLARWILMTQDRVGNDTFTMTQQFMSYMLGVQRPSLTLVIGSLQRKGLVKQGRGKMQVLDRTGLEAAACECYATIRRGSAWLAYDNKAPASPKPVPEAD